MCREKPSHAGDDALVNIKLASKEDAATVSAITDAAYSKYIPLLGRKPEPMTVDYGEMIAKHPVHFLMVGDRPAGVLVLEHEKDQTLIWSVAVHPDFQGRGLGLRLLRLATGRSGSTRIHSSRRTSPSTGGSGTRRWGGSHSSARYSYTWRSSWCEPTD
jgi:GNAT superfamily N-acetyltransferase